MILKSVVVSAFAALVLSTAAAAAPAEALAFSIGQCSAMPDDKARLSCYDQIASQLKAGAVPAAPVAQAAPAVPPVAPAPIPTQQVAKAPGPQSGGAWYNPADWFGKGNPQKASPNPQDFGAENIQAKKVAEAEPDRPRELDQISAKVTSATFNPFGRFTITLDNGQVWKQVEADTGTARLKKSGGDVVTISRGLLGSYNLVVEGRNALYKVTRIR